MIFFIPNTFHSAVCADIFLSACSSHDLLSAFHCIGNRESNHVDYERVHKPTRAQQNLLKIMRKRTKAFQIFMAKSSKPRKPIEELRSIISYFKTDLRCASLDFAFLSYRFRLRCAKIYSSSFAYARRRQTFWDSLVCFVLRKTSLEYWYQINKYIFFVIFSKKI